MYRVTVAEDRGFRYCTADAGLASRVFDALRANGFSVDWQEEA